MSAGNIRVAEWHAAIKKAMPEAEIAIRSDPAEAGRPLNNTRIVADLSFHPKYSTERAIAEYVQAVRGGTRKP